MSKCWEKQGLVAAMFLEVPRQSVYATSQLTLGFNVLESEPLRRQCVLLKMARIGQNKTLSQLGEAIGATDEAIRLWEKGERMANEFMREERFEKLAVALDQDVQLFNRLDPRIMPRFNVIERDPYKRQAVLVRMARIAQGIPLEQLGQEVNLCREALREREIGRVILDGVLLGKLAIALRQDINLFWS